MANYTTADIKALREKTGAGMLDVKKALDEADGDQQKAMEIIRVKGLKGVTKREGRHLAAAPGQSGCNERLVEVRQHRLLLRTPSRVRPLKSLSPRSVILISGNSFCHSALFRKNSRHISGVLSTVIGLSYGMRGLTSTLIW